VRTADVLIIGGGVIGASVAYHLAQLGCHDILVIDRFARPGEGSTGKATGGFRCQFATEINIRLSLLAREMLMRFEEETGIDSGYRQCGYLFLAHSAQGLSALRDALQLQHRSGLPEAHEVFPGEILDLNPFIHHGGILGGSFCPTDGFIRPMNILSGYRDASERKGVKFEFGVECASFELTHNRITKVRTSRGKISVCRVVNAAGAWAGELAKAAKLEIPLLPLRRQVAVVREDHLLPETMPMTIFLEDGFHFRVRDGRVLLLKPTDVPSSFDTFVEEDWISTVQELAHRRIRSLSTASIDRSSCWAGLYEMTPDKHALLGTLEECQNFYFVNGSSGHGVMHSPALGKLLAEIIVYGSARTLNVQPLRVSRFREGLPNSTGEFL